MRGHPLRGTRNFAHSPCDGVPLPPGGREEILLCFWRGALPDDRHTLYFSAARSKSQGGEVFLPLAPYAVHVTARAEGFKPVRKCYAVVPADGWGFAINELVTAS
ncbi:MAG TPA: hypothetical protein VG826_26140 [Pirellulales bacterium]|nr:hypothetical protein [Pirellulales bacterium]